MRRTRTSGGPDGSMHNRPISSAGGKAPVLSLEPAGEPNLLVRRRNWRIVVQSGRGPQPNIARDLVAPHKDLGRFRWFYAQNANLYRLWNNAGFSIPMPVMAPNLRDRRRNWLIVVQGAFRGLNPPATNRTLRGLRMHAIFRPMSERHVMAP